MVIHRVTDRQTDRPKGIEMRRERGLQKEVGRGGEWVTEWRGWMSTEDTDRLMRGWRKDVCVRAHFQHDEMTLFLYTTRKKKRNEEGRRACGWKERGREWRYSEVLLVTDWFHTFFFLHFY